MAAEGRIVLDKLGTWELLISGLALFVAAQVIDCATADAAPLDAWSEGRPVVVCVERNTVADFALAEWIGYLWSPNRQFYIDCVDPDLILYNEDCGRLAGFGCYAYGDPGRAWGSSNGVMLHEIGHAWGLDHPANVGSCQTPTLMESNVCGEQRIFPVDVARVLEMMRGDFID